MKIAIPIANDRLCRHFGHCQEFAVAEVDSGAGTVGEIARLQPPVHAPGVLPRWLHEQGVDLVIAGGMGQRAQALFQESGIGLHVGAPGLAPQDLLEAWVEGTLTAGANPCDH
jgi:predicted Fe-Mo cluster-binding NifX family protein